MGNDSTADSLVPVPVHNISNANQISTGSQHSCAILNNHEIQCWGRGTWGQLGNGSEESHLTPVAVKNL
ncbi:hypothetical protein KJ966_09935 [bacterium]|nr:hypothetical protein [bacterium]